MGTKTKIEWCDHTFNPWRGCAKVSPGCDFCYAEARSKINPAVLGEWGVGMRRAFATESYWFKPLVWDASANAAGVRARVFCGSMMDVFEDRPDLVAPRERLFNLIYECQKLDWLLLTKRIKNASRFIGGTSGAGLATLEHEYRHVWLGTTVESADYLHRAEELVKIPAVVRFLSLEPLLGSIHTLPLDGIGWVIVGCESGPNRRPFDNVWAQAVAEQCAHAGVPVFVKQLRDDRDRVVHGPAEWPGWPAWAVQEFPEKSGDTAAGEDE